MTLQAGTLLIFGIGTATQDWGLLQSYSIEDTVSRAEAKAPDGNIISIQEYTQVQTLTMDYYSLFVAISDPPEIGTRFTFDSKVWSIDKVRENNVVDGYQSYNVTAKYYPKLGG